MSPIDLLATYLHLAEAARLRRQPLVRDRVLLLAAVIAAQIELSPIAAACRELILVHNPRHLVHRWSKIGDALGDEDFQALVARLAARYGPEHVERLVEQLGIERAGERAAYASDGEYAAALLGFDWVDLVRRYGAESGD